MKNNVLVLCAIIAVSCLFSFTPVENEGYKIGDIVNDFKLINVNESYVSLSNFEDVKGAIVIFTCNHCPFSVKYEDRIIELEENFGSKGWPVIAINPNDPVQYPSDSFEAMQVRAKEKGFEFPYLFDETQEVAKKFGAKRTPHTFVLEKVKNNYFVRYIGAIDDDTRDENVEIKFVEYAINSIESGVEPNPNTTKAIGCSIKWK